MKFERRNFDYKLVMGTSLMGTMNITFNSLVDLFGDPGPGDDYKTDAEWIIKFEDGTVATIYNYKNGYAYLGKHDGLHIVDITNWNIGGLNLKAYHLVVEHCKDHLIGAAGSIYEETMNV